LFRFYQDLNRPTTQRRPLRSREIDVIYTHNDNRVIAFPRTAGPEQMLVVASLNDRAFDRGYVISADPSRLPTGVRKEVFNSDPGLLDRAGARRRSVRRGE